MTADIDPIETQLQRRERCVAAASAALLRGDGSLMQRAMGVAWMVATLARFTLPESADADRLGSNLALGVAAVGIATLGGRLFWALACLGVGHQLLWAGDWLTQTVVMLLVALVGTVTAPMRAAAGRRHPLEATALGLTVATYLVAVFHKLNSGFVDPALSCASHGWRRLAEEAGALGLATSPPGAEAFPHVILAFELAIAVLLVLRPRAGVSLAAIFHVPLTLALAPAFAFVMAVGWVAALGHDAVRGIVTTLAARWRVALVLVATAWCALAWVTLPEARWLAALKLALLLGVAVAAWLPVPGQAVVADTGADGLHGWRARALPAVAVLVFVLNAATPYLGTQFQHTGAMLSNLRIDSGCWNHLLVPESARRVDPYIRIDVAELGSAESRELEGWADTEAILLSQLWTPGALATMRQNWCSNERIRPITLRGTYRGGVFAVDDLCDLAEPLPPVIGLLGGEAWFGRVLRFQKNLVRTCPAACVH